MFNVENGTINQSELGWIPVYVDGEQKRLGIMSIGFLLTSKSDAVIWRGPKKNCIFEILLKFLSYSTHRSIDTKAMIKKFMNDVHWGELDFLLIDTPPGTSDEHLAVIENIRAMAFDDFAAILVTTPQVLNSLFPNSTI